MVAVAVVGTSAPAMINAAKTAVLIEEPEHPYLELELNSRLHQLSAAAVRYRIAVGPQAGRKTMTLRNPRAMVDDTISSKPFTAARDGFSINAAVGCEAHERSKLERLCRYMARPPIAEQRLSVDGDGLVVYELKHPFSDGTTHVLFEPVDFIAWPSPPSTAGMQEVEQRRSSGRGASTACPSRPIYGLFAPVCP